MNYKSYVISGLLLLLLLPFTAAAENSTKIPGYTIHHNAMTTDVLPPEVARIYNIQRSKNRGMLNIAIIKDAVEKTSTGASVPARVRVYAANLTGQTRAIPLREVREGEAIYYIGDFHVANQETLNFAMEVWPEHSNTSYTARVSQQFFN